MPNHVTLAGNVDLQSKQWTGFGKGHRYTEYAERLILNNKTFVSRQGYDPKAGFITFGAPHNEFMVAHRTPQAIVYDEDKLNPENIAKHINKIPNKEEMIFFLKQFASKFNLPLIDRYGRYH